MKTILLSHFWLTMYPERQAVFSTSRFSAAPFMPSLIFRPFYIFFQNTNGFTTQPLSFRPKKNHTHL